MLWCEGQGAGASVTIDNKSRMDGKAALMTGGGGGLWTEDYAIFGCRRAESWAGVKVQS